MVGKRAGSLNAADNDSNAGLSLKDLLAKKARQTTIDKGTIDKQSSSAT